MRTNIIALLSTTLLLQLTLSTVIITKQTPKFIDLGKGKVAIIIDDEDTQTHHVAGHRSTKHHAANSQVIAAISAQGSVASEGSQGRHVADDEVFDWSQIYSAAAKSNTANQPPSVIQTNTKVTRPVPTTTNPTVIASNTNPTVIASNTNPTVIASNTKPTVIANPTVIAGNPTSTKYGSLRTQYQPTLFATKSAEIPA